MERRHFIKSTSMACAGAVLVSLAAAAMTGCHSLPVFKVETNDPVIHVNTNQFVEGQKLLVVRHPKLEFDVLLVKRPDDTYNALYMQLSLIHI